MVTCYIPSGTSCRLALFLKNLKTPFTTIKPFTACKDQDESDQAWLTLSALLDHFRQILKQP